MQEISKFSVDNFQLCLLGRRQFLAALILSAIAQTKMISAQSLNPRTCHNHFYWLDLKTGEMNLPHHQIDFGQPGSIMKLIATAAILEECLPSAQKIIDCRGSIIVGRQLYHCRYPHGRLSIVEALGQSCNVFFAHTTQELHTDCFMHYLEKFGLGSCLSKSKTKGIESINLILGLSKQFNVNAIQILQLISLIAEKGKLLPIHYYSEDSGRKKSLENLSSQVAPAKVSDFQNHTWSSLQTGMLIACQSGTAKKLDPLNKLHLAAKTGTTTHGNNFQSWLAGYFPFEAPHYAFCFRAQAGTSYDKAVPLARRLLFERDWT